MRGLLLAVLVLVGCGGGGDGSAETTETTTTTAGGPAECIDAVGEDEAVEVCESLSAFASALAIAGGMSVQNAMEEAVESAQGRCERLGGADWQNHSQVCRDVAAFAGL